uniref:ACYPI30454 protein n=1 Tax=Acyrthosiphon pisum TaxID=7029 RepID=C4WSW5_ACYPI|nr:ACYPI30454 [Acyrthosiphon pisum]
MAETPCFFGLTTVRVGTRVVAYLQFWSQLFIVMLLMFKYFNHWLDTDASPTTANTNATAANETAATSTAMKYYSELDFDISIFSQLSGSLLVIYTSYYLRIATYTHNLMYINFWMIVNSLNFVTSVAFIIFAAWRIGKCAIFLTGLIGCFAKAYKLYVVYQFYTDETLPVAVNDSQNPASNGVQSLPQNHAAVEIRTETISANDHRRSTLDIKNITQTA